MKLMRTGRPGIESPTLLADDGSMRDLSEVVEMPHGSPWPIVLALALSLVFAMLVLEKYGAAAIGGILCIAALAGWHWHEPEEATG